MSTSVKGFLVDDEIHKYDFEALDNKPVADTTLSQTGKFPDSKTVGEEIANLKEDLKLLTDEIPNTVQTYTFSGGSVSKVEHKANNVAVRTDTFSYGTNTITEVRRLNTGESLTIVTNLTTLETTVTYAAA